MKAPDRSSRLYEPMMSRRHFLGAVTGVFIGGAASSLLSACAQVPAHQHTVTITDEDHFVPGNLSIPLGDSVVWTNQGGAPHTATCDPARAVRSSDAQFPSGASAWNSGSIQPGGSWTYQFTTPGRYVYFSIGEEQGGFVGTVVVKA